MNFSTKKQSISAVAEDGYIKTIFLTAASHVGRVVAWVFHHLRKSMSWSTSAASAKQDGNSDLRALKTAGWLRKRKAFKESVCH